ncbi:MAG TPA: hypothetical protein VEC96_03585 [Anaerolineae bacterium]|nr:hypothetical protein [Anaerolineae bacterium]
MRNPSGPLSSYLMVVAILYDSQDRVINFGNYHQPAPTALVGDQMMDFEICVDPLDQTVTRYELRAWGL